MSKIFKLSVSLILNQILATVGGFMCIIFVNLVAGDTIGAHLLFLALTLPFFVYINYRAAFTSAFHDADRRNKPQSQAFLFKGAVAGAISIIPLFALVTIYLYFHFTNQVPWANSFKFITRVCSMYYNFPMCNLFPNHCPEVLVSSLFIPIISSWLGYGAGSKNFSIYDKILILLKNRK